jgi:hypothetical protein
MKKANLPGFSAASSLYTRGTPCHVAMGRRGGNGATVVIPQLPRSFRCFIALGAADAICKVASASACIGAVIKAESVCRD